VEGAVSAADGLTERWADFAPWVAQWLTVRTGGVPANVGHVPSPKT